MIEIRAGDDEQIEITIKDNVGDPVPLTATEIAWGIAPEPYGTPKITKSTADGDVSVVDADAGRVNVILEPADTADLGGDTYYQEIQLTDGSGNLTTAALDNLRVRPTILN